MRIVRVTVAEGVAHVEIEGLDVPIIVTEGKSMSLEMLAVHGQASEVVKFEWVENGNPATMVAAAKPVS